MSLPGHRIVFVVIMIVVFALHKLNLRSCMSRRILVVVMIKVYSFVVVLLRGGKELVFIQ